MDNLTTNIRFLSIFLILALFSCSSATIDPITGERKTYELDEKKRIRENVEKGGGIFGNIGGGSKDTTFSFATSNVLWRATLKSLDFMPLASIDYSGGILVTDWYSESANPQEKIKITVRFLSNELRSDSVVVISHKMTCNSQGLCSTISLNENFNVSVKDTIITTARLIKIEDEKKKIK
jgi:hypothetical protein